MKGSFQVTNEMLSQDKKPKIENSEMTELPLFDPNEEKVAPKKTKPKEKLQKAIKRKSPKAYKNADDLTASSTEETVNKEKTIFIICVCLLSPLILFLALVIVSFFLLLFGGILLLSGALTVGLVGLAATGAVLAVVGIVYGAILLFMGEGIEVLAGQYELGIGIAVTGITVILSVLLYSGITELIPFLMKKTAVFLKFTFKKIKELAIYVYRRCTGV